MNLLCWLMGWKKTVPNSLAAVQDQLTSKLQENREASQKTLSRARLLSDMLDKKVKEDDDDTNGPE